MNLLIKIRQLFCRHAYVMHYTKGGFHEVEGWAVQPFILRCKKCGKVIKPLFKE